MSLVTKAELEEFKEKYYPSEDEDQTYTSDIDVYDVYETHKTRVNERFLQIPKSKVKCFGINMFVEKKNKQRELVARYCDHCDYSFECAYMSLLNCDLDGVWGGTLVSPRRKVIIKIKQADLFANFDEEAEKILIKITKELQLIK